MKKMLIFNSEEEWLNAKKSKMSASNISRLLADGKGEGLSVGAKTYCFELFVESIAVDIYPSFMNQSMEHGNNTEFVVIGELNKLFPLDEILHFGSNQYVFCLYNEHSGASPDCIVLGKFGIEIKCPTSKEIHTERIMSVHDNESLFKHDKIIFDQIQFNMMSTGMDKWLFVSYYEGMKEPSLGTHTVWIYPDKDREALIDLKIDLGAKEIDRLQELYQEKLRLKKLLQ